MMELAMLKMLGEKAGLPVEIYAHPGVKMLLALACRWQREQDVMVCDDPLPLTELVEQWARKAKREASEVESGLAEAVTALDLRFAAGMVEFACGWQRGHDVAEMFHGTVTDGGSCGGDGK